MTCTNCKRVDCPTLTSPTPGIWRHVLDCERAKSAALAAALIAEAEQLERWANESRAGRWSTHQVDPMRRRADELRRLASWTVRE